MELKDTPVEAEFRAKARAGSKTRCPPSAAPSRRSWRTSSTTGARGSGCSSTPGTPVCPGRRSTAAAARTPNCVRSSTRNSIGPARPSGSTSSARTSPARRSSSSARPRSRSATYGPILTGDELWCQLFSEPEAGSDLASLRTSATKVPGGWRIQGQKIWTSRAQLAAHAILLARTGGGPRHKGITYFLLPMDSPGVDVRPLAHMLGEAEFNEVFLDDVFIPDDGVLGDVDGGWQVAMATLAFERVAIATGRVNTTGAVNDLIREIADRTTDDGAPLGTDPLVRQRIADLYGRALVHYLIGQRVVTGAAGNGPPGPVTSIGKLFFCPLVEDIADFGLELDEMGGQFALAEKDSSDAP